MTLLDSQIFKVVIAFIIKISYGYKQHVVIILMLDIFRDKPRLQNKNKTNKYLMIQLL